MIKCYNFLFVIQSYILANICENEDHQRKVFPNIRNCQVSLSSFVHLCLLVKNYRVLRAAPSPSYK